MGERIGSKAVRSAATGIVLGILLLAGSTAPVVAQAPAKGAGDQPKPRQARESVAAAATGGQTTTSVDVAGTEVYRVDDGFDLDQYLFADGSPLDFSIDVSRDFGPVDVIGRPAAGNALFGKTGRITIRVFDVDDDYSGTDHQPELDKMVVNGTTLPGFLSGANDQWSINSFAVPLNLLRLPTAANPTGRNDFQVLIDTGNGGTNVWAVEVAWAELRLVDTPPPAAFIHGITGATSDPDGSSMDTFRDYFVNQFPVLDGKTISPSLTENGTIQENARLLAPKIDDLLARTGAAQVNIVGHSFGGLNARLYAFDHPGIVRSLGMVGTPNGGSRLADILCANRNIPFLLKGLASFALDYATKQFGECDGPQDGLYQLQQSYVQDTFNKQVPDRRGVSYFTIAGQKNTAGAALLDGEDDGTVTVASVRYLRPNDPSDPNPGHPGLQVPLKPAYEKNHSGLIQADSPAMPRALCQLYLQAQACGGTGQAQAAPASRTAAQATQAAQAAPSGDLEFVASAGPDVPAGASVNVPLAFEGAANAVVLILVESDQVQAELPGATFEATDVFEAPALVATLTAPANGVLRLSNTGSSTTGPVVLVAVQTERMMTVEASPTLARSGSPVTINTTLTPATSGDAPRVEVVNASGSVVADLPLGTGGGPFSISYTPPAPGSYSVRAFVEGGQPRWASDVFFVGSGAATISGGFSETLTGNEDGQADALVLRPNLAVGTAGSYRLAGRLVDGSGNQVAAAGAVGNLGTGAQSLPLSFPGRDIFASGLSGPYRLVDVVLSRDDAGLTPEDEKADLGLTAAYGLHGFEHDTVQFDLGGFADQGVDSNSDGRFDTLRVTGSVRVDASGSYAVNARLVAPDGTEVVETQSVVSLAAGSNQFVLSFEGEAIGTAGRNGPFTVEDLSVYSVSNADAAGYLVKAHTTAAYGFNQFIGEPATITIGDVSVIEGSQGTTDASFTVTLSKASTRTITVDFATADGTATAPADFEASNGTIAFAPGETTKSVVVRVVGDTIAEPAENFAVDLTRPVGAQVADGSGAGTIIDDDDPCARPRGPVSGPLFDLGGSFGGLGAFIRLIAVQICRTGA